jgi:hypothetical protein
MVEFRKKKEIESKRAIIRDVEVEKREGDMNMTKVLYMH